MTVNNRKKEIFENVLTSTYNYRQYVKFLRELLNDFKLVAPNKFNKAYSSSNVIDGHYHIGNYLGTDGKKVALFSVQLKRKGYVENARSSQRAFIKDLLEKYGCDGALAAFYTMEKDVNGQEICSEKWRLSFIRMEYGFANGKISTKLTPAKRYSYLVGKGEPCHTAKERLYGIFIQDDFNPSLDELEEAFSVETVTEKFFAEYKEKYLALKECLEGTNDFMEEAERCGFSSEQFTKKLMGQIVFLYFIQKKGWLGVDAFPLQMTKKEYDNARFSPRNSKARSLVEKIYSPPDENEISHINQVALFSLSDEDATFVSKCVKGKSWGEGPKNFMRALFNSCVKQGKNYFDDYLEPLFYEALNKNRGEHGYYARFHRKVPFLNGGLFEELDHYEWQNCDFHIPNEIFSNVHKKGKDEADGILDIFDRYNFTMAEDEPMEREVAIDPEMLGKVFENLLDVKDRKSKGAFYTPREIVHYMCQESLINYLVTNTGLAENDVRKFIIYGEYFRDSDTRKTIWNATKKKFELDKKRNLEIPESIFSFKGKTNRLKELDDLLANVKVADLAVGSGAFLLGLLNEIVRARQTLSSYMAIEMNSFDKMSFYSYGRKSYDLKMQTIKNCLFACDLEPSATDITKLRLWLSIVIDDEISSKDDSNGMFDVHTVPRQLPNLDCNVICGNSLIDEFEGIKLITESRLLNNQSPKGMDSFLQAGFDNMLKELIRLQDELYFTKDHESKWEILRKIHDIYDRIILHQLEGSSAAINKYKQLKHKNQKPFVLWQLYFPKVFRENNGFDIVIGNPPYVGEKGNKELFRPIAETTFGHRFYCGKMDLFYFFFHKAIDLGKSNAEISFITTNYYPTAFGGKLLRKDFKERTQIRRMINLNEMKVFKNAMGQHDLITMLTKNKDKEIESRNCLCNVKGYVDSNLLRTVLYSLDEPNEYMERYIVKQSDLYEGEEEYLRIAGCGDTTNNSINSVLKRIADTPLLLKDIAEIKQGIVSGADKYTDAHEQKFGLGFPKGKGIFVLSKTELDNLRLTKLEKDKYVKPVYKNKQVSKYNIKYDDSLWVLYMTNKTIVSEVPNILAYLNQFKPLLEHRLITYNESYPWYALHRERDERLLDSPEKIVNSRRAIGNIFALETRHYFEQSDMMVTVIKKEFEQKFPVRYVLGLLNSKLYYVWLRNRGKVKGRVLELYGRPLEEIPLKIPTNDIKEVVIKAVSNILNCDNRDGYDVKFNMDLIDNSLYELYGLTEKEISMVEYFADEA